MERIINVEKVSLRKELENIVISNNKFLKKVVATMDNIILLRNCHPSYRTEFASALHKAEMITKLEASEFVKFVGYATN